MKTLTSSCSKAIVNNLLDKRSGSINVSDHTHGICLRSSRNYKFGNFQFLQLVSVKNKAIHPIHAVESKTLQEDLETVDLETESQETRNNSKLIRVRFQLQRKCIFGQQFFIVGDDPLVGSWNPSKGIPMAWSEGHIWDAELDIPAGKTIQFKFVLEKQGGKLVWQPGSDRILHTWENMNTITVYEDWENAEMQKIMEEESLLNDDEMPTLDEDLDDPNKTLAPVGDSQTRSEEKPLAEPDLQQMLGDNIDASLEKESKVTTVAEEGNIGSSEDNGMKMISARRKPTKKMTRGDEESPYSARNDAIVQDLIDNGIITPAWNQDAKVVDGNLLEFDEDSPNSDRVE